MKLKVIHRYQNRRLSYEKDTVIEVPEVEGEHLLVDAPGCFKVIKEKDLSAPENKQITKDEAKTK